MVHEILTLAALSLSADSRTTAGALLLTIVAVESGGLLMLRVVRGQHPMTEFQHAFARAGHAHAGVLVTLALVGQILADAADLSGPLAFFARSGIWAAAILMSAGFFLSSAGRDVTKPNRLIVLVYAGGVSLALGVVSLGIALRRSGPRASSRPYLARSASTSTRRSSLPVGDLGIWSVSSTARTRL